MAVNSFNLLFSDGESRIGNLVFILYSKECVDDNF